MGDISNINEKVIVEKLQIKNTIEHFDIGKKECNDINKKDVIKAVKALNTHIENEEMQAVYEFHNKFKNDIIIKIINKRTKEVVMEIPPRKFLDMIAGMCESNGVIFDKKA